MVLGLLLWTLWDLGSLRKKDPTPQIQEGKPAQDVPRFARARAMTTLFEISGRRYYLLARATAREEMGPIRFAFTRSCLRPAADRRFLGGAAAGGEAHTKVRVRVIIIGVVLFVVSAGFFVIRRGLLAAGRLFRATRQADELIFRPPPMGMSVAYLALRRFPTRYADLTAANTYHNTDTYLSP